MTGPTGVRRAALKRDADAAKLLRKLLRKDARLTARDDELLLTMAGGAAARAIDAAIVRYCICQDWLRPKGKVVVPTDAGEAWLRRLEGGDEAYRHQHQIRNTADVEIEGVRRPVLVNEGESPLGWLKNRKDRNGRPLISEAQYEAGERLRSDYTFAHLTPRVTANWGALAPSAGGRRGPPSNAASLRDEVMAAKARVGKALEAAGPELAGVLVDVCCELKGLEDAEKAHGWPQRAGKVVLQIALTRLARHYGLISNDRRGTGRLRHWGEADYRPTIERWTGDGD
ncbi:hypothetical protein A7A08_02167 [Methyloligella halotolerans]|uniref:DUF6456 domain-containing protein n=1 Tax=Methyloligella halotolerans TaxID=1177755 RepID=A0A1E2RXK7_9HYPH|nr:DUF6456 domain-containing protein [Methyloligella halotolerans]ODA66870.1 hypothetical protein A7A08_02167 [Methyloligella halotolerans]